VVSEPARTRRRARIRALTCRNSDVYGLSFSHRGKTGNPSKTGFELPIGAQHTQFLFKESTSLLFKHSSTHIIHERCLHFQVAPGEATIVLLVLVLWVCAILLFVHRWGKIRMLVPHQPRYAYDDSNAHKLKVKYFFALYQRNQ